MTPFLAAPKFELIWRRSKKSVAYKNWFAGPGRILMPCDPRYTPLVASPKLEWKWISVAVAVAAPIPVVKEA